MILHLTMNPPIMILMMITIMIAVQEVLVLLDLIQVLLIMVHHMKALQNMQKLLISISNNLKISF